MENAPPNYTVTFYNGTKITTDTTTSSVSVKETQQAELKIGMNTQNLPQHLVPLFKHAQDCLQQCLEVEANADASTRFPLVLKII